MNNKHNGSFLKCGVHGHTLIKGLQINGFKLLTRVNTLLTLVVSNMLFKAVISLIVSLRY